MLYFYCLLDVVWLLLCFISSSWCHAGLSAVCDCGVSEGLSYSLTYIVLDLPGRIHNFL